MKRKSKLIRINYSTYLKIRKTYKQYRNESMADYFERIADALKFGLEEYHIDMGELQ